ncbi:MAG TPA: hypothetical protein DCS12_05095 [Clostridiales bacterium]|jgi:hypothetical protein|nr:hypothetical protein [Clostridiales bacterium]
MVIYTSDVKKGIIRVDNTVIKEGMTVKELRSIVKNKFEYKEDLNGYSILTAKNEDRQPTTIY